MPRQHLAPPQPPPAARRSRAQHACPASRRSTLTSGRVDPGTMHSAGGRSRPCLVRRIAGAHHSTSVCCLFARSRALPHAVVGWADLQFVDTCSREPQAGYTVGSDGHSWGFDVTAPALRHNGVFAGSLPHTLAPLLASVCFTRSCLSGRSCTLGYLFSRRGEQLGLRACG